MGFLHEKSSPSEYCHPQITPQINPAPDPLPRTPISQLIWLSNRERILCFFFFLKNQQTNKRKLFFFFFLFRATPAAYRKFPGYGSNWSCSCCPTPQPQQRRILNPLRETRGRIPILMDTSWVRNRLSHNVNSTRENF